MMGYRKSKCVIAALIVGAALHMSSAATASDNGMVTYMKLEFASGSNTVLSIADGLMLKIGEGTLTVVTPENKIAYELCDIRRFTYSESPEPSSVLDEADVATSAVSVTLTSGGVVIAGAPAGSRCEVYDINGAQMRAMRFDGELTLATGDLPPGHYVVTVNGVPGLKIKVK